ncbi:hypothetical protein E2C01_024933 [Portunus trituberculatus]|uniref:Uncharacterized protein n=1 Tax=Portunus trituberculatus TaxID=210409 RepID=A0A5B7EE95_PORTR|nr:hypothetical protein [Portunus trituberculatus]
MAARPPVPSPPPLPPASRPAPLLHILHGRRRQKRSGRAFGGQPREAVGVGARLWEGRGGGGGPGLTKPRPFPKSIHTLLLRLLVLESLPKLSGPFSNPPLENAASPKP